MSARPIFAYQARLPHDLAADAVLSAYAALHGRAERSLFAAMQKPGFDANATKREFLQRFGLTSRQYNAIRIGLDGMIASIKERRPGLITEAETRIKRAQKVIAKLETRSPGTNNLHQKKRRLATLQARCSTMKTDRAAGAIRLCFGSRKLFRAQFDLEANGSAAHSEWKSDWRAARSAQLFVLGSGDETAGNQTCQAFIAEDGSLTLTLRLPDGLSGHHTHLTIPGIRFAYGQEAIVAALQSSRRVSATTKTGKPTAKRIGSALSYRFLRDERGWRVFVSVDAALVKITTSTFAGAIGVDINADHLAASETDRFGNWVGSTRIDLVAYGKTPDQAKALIGDAAVRIAANAKAAGKPVVIESLNFAKKKAELEAVDARQARMLSSFASNKVVSSIKAACFRAGVEVIEVNPAYTSVIGAVNHAQRLGISVHQGAALAVARRGLGLSDAPAVRQAIVPVRNGDHVTFALPVRNRTKHVWSHWSKIRTCLKAAHAAHVRSGLHNEAPAPLSPEMRAVSATWISTAKSRGANRSQHCSESVWPDVPY